MKDADTNEPMRKYPPGSRLLLYELLLDILYKQNLISKGTFTKGVQHVESAVERSVKGQ